MSEKIFVVQEHKAKNLHYDFRLEIGRTLKSWALPKGIPKSGEKHLAVMTENHPMSYADFEGIIPKGEYGAGNVEIWDRGTYENRNSEEGKIISMTRALKFGKLHFELKGKKLRGDYVLIKFKGQDKNWLMMHSSK